MPRATRLTGLGDLPIQLDPRARDFDTLRTQVLQMVSALTSQWTDFYPGDGGVAMLEAVAYLTDTLSYYEDRGLNESYLYPAQRAESVRSLLALINYVSQMGATASVDLDIQVTTPSVTLPIGWTVWSKATTKTPRKTFELLAPVTILAPGASVLAPVTAVGAVTVYEGNSHTLESIGVSNGRPFQSFTLPSAPVSLVSLGTSPVTIQIGSDLWTGVAKLTGYDSDSQVFEYFVDRNGYCTCRFGDGVFGAIPGLGNGLFANYRDGGGGAANGVGTGKLVNFSTASVVGDILSVTNPAQPSGGAYQETDSHAKLYGPLSNRSQDRVVTLEDAEIEARGTSGVSVAAVKAAEGSVVGTLRIRFAVSGSNPVPTGKWYPQIGSGTGAIGAVGRHLKARCHPRTLLFVYPPVLVAPRLGATIKVATNSLREEVRVAVQRRLVAYFQGVQGTLGTSVPLSDVIAEIEAVRGVTSVVPSSFYRIPGLSPEQGTEGAAEAASVTFVAETACAADVYSVLWDSATTFRLEGVNHGPIVDENGAWIVFTQGVAQDVSVWSTATATTPEEAPQFSLQIDTGATVPAANDEWSFSVDDYLSLDSMAVRDRELLVTEVYPNGTLSPDQFDLSYLGGIGV